jgi:hypothetical protein
VPARQTSGILTNIPPPRLNSNAPLGKPIPIGNDDTLKISLVTKADGKGKRPHQAFVVLKEEESGLEAPFPLNVKESGKATVSIVSGYCTLTDVRRANGG